MHSCYKAASLQASTISQNAVSKGDENGRVSMQVMPAELHNFALSIQQKHAIKTCTVFTITQYERTKDMYLCSHTQHNNQKDTALDQGRTCLLYTSPSPRDS